MKNGRRKHSVMLQRAVETKTATGAIVKTFDDLGYWSCHRMPVSVREAFIDGGIRDESDARLVGRSNSTVASMRAVDRAVSRDGATVFNLAGPPMISDDNREVTLRVKSGLNDG